MEHHNNPKPDKEKHNANSMKWVD